MKAELIKKNETYLTWAYRILLTLNLYFICAGYISYLQTKHQLTSPLIPKNAVDTIILNTNIIESSLISGIMFLISLWLYSFNYKKIAIIVMVISAICHQAIAAL